MECSKCGVSDAETLLYDVISGGNVVKMCEKCSRGGESPVLRRPTVFQLKEAQRRPTVYEILSKAAGIKPDERKIERTFNLQKQEISLKGVVDRNYREKIKGNAQPRDDLIHNFHWILMRVRRSRKITQKQLADAIGEPEIAVKMAEEGVLPKDNKLINKLQNYFKINLMKEGKPLDQVNSPSENRIFPASNITGFDKETTKALTIHDLKKMKEEKKTLFSGENPKELEDAFGKADLKSDKGSTKKDKDDLSDEDIKKIIFNK